MSNWLSYLFAVGVVIGGTDRLIGNRFGLGERFEEAFRLLGPTALSMAGILCLCPLLTNLFQVTLSPVLVKIGLDPAVLSGILAIDMGGYQLAQSLALSPAVGVFFGVTVAATFGCTFSFTIPVGYGMMPEENRQAFLQGILLGLPSLLVCMLVGGLLSGLRFYELLFTCFPLILFCIIFWALSRKQTALLIRVLQFFAKFLQALATVGLILGAVTLLTGRTLLSNLLPLKDAMNTCVEICVSLLGSLPLAELFRKLLTVIFRKYPTHQCSTDGICACFFTVVSVLSALSMVPSLSKKEQYLVGACCVCGASILPHLGFLLSAAPQYVGTLLAAKLAGFLFACLYVLFHYRKMDHQS